MREGIPMLDVSSVDFNIFGGECTCNYDYNHQPHPWVYDPNCFVHKDDWNRKMVVEIEHPTSIGLVERVWPEVHNGTP